jgi:hypothetical protein
MTISFHRAEDIGLAIKARFETLLTTNSAETDIGRVVYLGRRHFDDTMIPGIALIEDPDEPARQHRADEYQIVQVFTAFAYVACDPSNPNVAAHKALRDMKKALWNTDGKPDATLGGKVRSLVYRGREIGPRADGVAHVVAAIQFAVQYVEILSTP